MVARAEVLVEFENQVVEAVQRRIRAARGEVIGLRIIRSGRRGVGHGIEPGDLARDGVDPLLRNDVAGEWIASPGAVDVAAGGGIVDRDTAAARVHEFGEIAVLHLRRRYGQDQRLWRALAIALVVKQEESLVLAVINLR